jgi:hypothetical protein
VTDTERALRAMYWVIHADLESLALAVEVPDRVGLYSGVLSRDSAGVFADVGRACVSCVVVSALGLTVEA